MNKTYVDCLTSSVQSGRFRSMEINRATLELTVACVDQREAYAQQCTVSGGPFRVPYCDGSVCVKTELEECRLRAGFLAAMAVKLQEHNDLIEQLNAASRGK